MERDCGRERERKRTRKRETERQRQTETDIQSVSDLIHHLQPMHHFHRISSRSTAIVARADCDKSSLRSPTSRQR